MNALDNEIQQLVAQLNAQYAHLRAIDQTQRQQHAALDDLSQRVAALAAALDAPVDLTPIAPPVASLIRPALGALPAQRQREITRLFTHSTDPIPPLDALDRFVIMSVGLLAVAADVVLVGLPDSGWVIRNDHKTVPVGVLSQFLKDQSVKADNVLASLFKVGYDRATTPGMDSGMFPANHRLLSFGHDPSPLGFLIGMIDIINGGMTAITTGGTVYHLAGVPATQSRAILAPLIWLGHLISDVATPMGLPFPGMVLTQFLQVPFGKEGTLADLGHYMYLAGYDLRHYSASGVVPALIEVLIRAYVWLRDANELSDVDAHFWHAEHQQALAQDKRAKLQAMLFWTHALALAGNAGKVGIVGATTGSLFDAALGVNLLHWQLFVLRTLTYISEKSRDTTLAQIAANRDHLSAQRAILSNVSFADVPVTWL